MRIQRNLPTTQYKLTPKTKTHNSPSFLGARLPEQTFEAFTKWAEITNFVNKIPEILRTSNIVGEGTRHIIYKIPDNDTFLLRRMRSRIPNIAGNTAILQLTDVFPNNNFGQAIASLGNIVRENIQVIIKQDGKPNGISNWLQINFRKLLPQNILEFITQLKRVSIVRENAYDVLTKEVMAITNKGLNFDFSNPQNVLVHEDEALNLVDIDLRREPSTGNCAEFIPTSLVHSLIDEIHFPQVYQSANTEQRNELKTYAGAIKSKIERSAKKNAIHNNEKAFYRYLSEEDIPITLHQRTQQIIGDFSF